MTTLLHIYRAPSGQWSGRMIENDQEIGGIAGCFSPREVEQTAYDLDFYPDEILAEDGTDTTNQQAKMESWRRLLSNNLKYPACGGPGNWASEPATQYHAG